MVTAFAVVVVKICPVVGIQFAIPVIKLCVINVVLTYPVFGTVKKDPIQNFNY
jgi:hypothetical protein